MYRVSIGLARCTDLAIYSCSICSVKYTLPFSVYGLIHPVAPQLENSLKQPNRRKAKEDIQNGFIHVHRQQVQDWDENGHMVYYEVPYTKDEKRHPHDGRYVPLLPEAEKIIDLAMSLPGESEYLFHDGDDPVKKGSYAQNLKFFCRRIGLTTTNNHAFRMAFNSRLIEMDFSSSDRALILGHQVQTNETHYSLTDKRRLANIKARLEQKEGSHS